MTAPKEIKDLQVLGIVRQLLEENEMYRDNDKKLSAKIWAIQMGGMDTLKKLSAFDFLVEYTGGDKLCSQESIGRVRRALQQKSPHLRGKNYEEKRTKRQSEVRNELGYTP